MNNTQCSGLEFQNGNMTFDVCYSLINHSSDRISIKGIIRPKHSNNETYACFQFYNEKRRISNSGWILDNGEENVPYYYVIDDRNLKWSDKPKYNLCTKGKIIFSTLIAEVEKRESDKPKDWEYEIILGFSWGMRSDNGTSIENIPIKNICKNRLKLLVNLLLCKYPEMNSKTMNDLIKGKTCDISGMW